MYPAEFRLVQVPGIIVFFGRITRPNDHQNDTGFRSLQQTITSRKKKAYLVTRFADRVLKTFRRLSPQSRSLVLVYTRGIR